MDIKPDDKTIRELLLSGSEFQIPRFQREYSWDQQNYKEFLEDMINCLVIRDGSISNTQYFLGTMLFIGNYSENNDSIIDVVDGQQRLTTITILFSAMSDRLKEMGEDILSSQLFRYIMNTDDDGNPVRILRSKTHYPYFSFFIQDREKENKFDANTEEEICIKDTYDFIYNNLSEKSLKNQLMKRFGSDSVEPLGYVDILKSLRDQVLETTFVSISTKDKTQANMIFEILNAKGKHLSYVDLIKNKIFEVLSDTEPADFAYEKWNSIKNRINDIDIGMATFYRHFWNAKYARTTKAKLYDAFNRKITPKSKERFVNFLNEMEIASKNYVKAVAPTRELFDNRKEYYPMVQSLKALTDTFGIVQARMALIVMFEMKDEGKLDFTTLADTIGFMEKFHFAYNAITSGRSNRFDSIYSKFALKLKGSTSKRMSKELIEEDLFGPLHKLFPSYDEFEAKFTTLTYSKKSNPDNIKTKYALNKINSYYEDIQLFVDDSSVEHIMPEDSCADALNIGNLILLEQSINNELLDVSYSEKRESYKTKSRYKWINEFADENADWTVEDIKLRAKELAKLYYTRICGILA